jgi:hypothetical protein
MEENKRAFITNSKTFLRMPKIRLTMGKNIVWVRTRYIERKEKKYFGLFFLRTQLHKLRQL